MYFLQNEKVEKVERSKMLERVLLWIIKESGEAWWGEPTCKLWAVNKKINYVWKYIFRSLENNFNRN